MKRYSMLLLGLIVVLGLGSSLQAQSKIAYVNSELLLSQYQPALEAQKQLNKEARMLETRYNEMLTQLDSLAQAYERTKLVLSESSRAAKEAEITQLQTEIQRYQVEKLGPQGEIYKRQQELLGPILEKVQLVIQEIGKRDKYDFILDVVGGNVLYAEPKFDITNDILYELERTE